MSIRTSWTRRRIGVTNKARKIGTTARKSVPELGRVGRRDSCLRGSRPGVRELAGRVVRGVRFCTLKVVARGRRFRRGAGAAPATGRPAGPSPGTEERGRPRRFSAAVRRLRQPGTLYAADGAVPPRIPGCPTPPGTTRCSCISTTCRQATRPHAETRAKREFETLHRLQLHALGAARPRFLASRRPATRGEMHFFTVTRPAGSFRRESSVGREVGHPGAAGLRQGCAGARWASSTGRPWTTRRSCTAT